MTIGQKVRIAREFRKMSQEELGQVIGLKKSKISHFENGSQTLNSDQLSIIIKHLNVDPRYFFDKQDDKAPKDLYLYVSEAAAEYENPKKYDDLVREIQDMKQKINPVSKIDPIAERVMINAELYSIVEKIQFLEGSALKEINALITGYLAAKTPKSEKERRHA